MLFSNSILLKRNIEYEEDNLMYTIFVQNRNAYAVEMGVDDDEEKDVEEDKAFDWVFDPSYYIVEDADSEKQLDTDVDKKK